MSLYSDLQSIMSSLDQVRERLSEVEASVDPVQREDVVLDLHEVERHVVAAARRLQRSLNGAEGAPPRRGA